MRKILSLLLAAALLLLALAGCSQAQEEEPLPESIEINFFYNDPYVPEIWDTYRAIGAKHEEQGLREEAIDKYTFYKRGTQTYAAVVTGERALYANVILKKGVVKE